MEEPSNRQSRGLEEPIRSLEEHCVIYLGGLGYGCSCKFKPLVCSKIHSTVGV